MNPLLTENDIESYRIWLKSKDFHYLRCILGNLKRDQLKEKPVYLNLSLRIEMVNKEMLQKQNR